MNSHLQSENRLSRLQFLARVVVKESRHLTDTDRRLFASGLTAERLAQLDQEPDLAERIDAFVSRFARLQDTVGDKLLPALLGALGEKLASAIDNLDRAERFGWIDSADAWFATRSLRNQMVHDYVEDPNVLWNALDAAHRYVPILVAAADRMNTEITHRGWA